MKAKIQPINPTTYEVSLLGGDKVEIGDREATDFKPHLKLNRWDGECFIAVKPANLVEEEIEYEVEEGKVKSKYKVKYEDDTEEEFESEFYPLEPRTVITKDKDGKDVEFRQCELGGFEFEIILKKKPKTNQIILNIETQGLKFFYQPELTAEEIEQGCIRPENVVSSYAVYHATRTPFYKNKEDAEKYKCGKAFHIYRPKITDAEGKWVWGELSLNEKAGTLTTTILQDFLDSAVYPVSTGTTNFGYETGKLANSTLLEDNINGLLATCADGGTADSITVWVKASVTGKLKAAIYDTSYNLIANGVTEECSIADGDDKWMALNFIGEKPSLSASTDYWLVASSNVLAHMFYDSGSRTILNRYPRNYEDGFPSSITDPNIYANYDSSIYCTYEEAAAGIPVQSFMHMQRLRRQ